MNGDFTLTVKYPISDSGIYQLIQEDMLIKAPTPVLGAQLFRIKKPIEHNDHLEITAYHISDDVMQRSITPVSVTSQSCGMALSRMVQNTKTALGDFSFNSDIQDRRTFNTTETETLYSVLLDGKHSIVGTWEGELVRDNFAMTVKKSRGENRGVVITTHKNLKDYQRTKNSQNVVTRIHAKSTFKPEGADKETTIRVTVDSPLINSYPYINEKEYENNNAKSVEELQKWAQAKFTNQGIDKVSDAIKIEAFELDGQVVHMGDTANLKSWKHNVDVFKKAISYEFDALKEEYISLTFDDKAGTGGSRASGGLSSAADAILGVTESAQEIALEKALQNADLGFDHQAGLLRQEILDGIELAKAKTEEVKRELSDTINQRFDSFENGPLQDAKRRAIEALRNAGASSLLAQEAKRISLDSITKLEEFKRQTFNTQSALSGAIDALKRTVTSEVNQASEYRRTTTEALSRMTGQMDGFATKSEVKQDIDGLTQTFAKMRVGGRNYAEDYDFSRGLWIYSQGDSSPIDWKIINGEYNVKGTTNTWKQMQIYSKEGSRASGKSSTALLDLEIGETYTLSFQGICYSGSSNIWVSLRANRTSSGNPEIINGNFNLTSSWQTYQVTIPALTKPDNFDFWRIILGYNEIGHVAFRKVELTRSSTRIDAGPAPEDGKTDLIVAKSEFQKTAEGLRTDLSAIQEYVSQDGQRQEVLRRYTREESARQANAVRELVARDYVGKSTYQEDVRGIERRLEAITNPQNGSIATQIANYKNSVDGRFADITSLISGKANQTDFQRVQETSKLYERIIGSNENDISNKVARMALTNQLFQVEVAKITGRNLIRNFDWNGLLPLLSNQVGWKFERVEDQFAKSGYMLKATCTQAGNGGFHKVLFNLRPDEFQGKDMTWSWDMKSSRPITFYYLGFEAGGLKKNVPVSTEWERISNTFKVAFNRFYSCVFYANGWEVGDVVYIRDPQLEEGTIATTPKRAPEDTEEAIRSVQTQLNGSWSVQNINSAGDLISGINLGANGHNRFVGKLTHITGETLIDKAVIKSAMVDKLKTANFEAGSVTTVILDAEAVTAEKLKVDQAFFNKLVANEAYLSQLFAKRAFITRVQSVTLDASQIKTGVLTGGKILGGTITGSSIAGGTITGGTITGSSISGATLTGHTKIKLGTYGSFDTVDGGLQINVPRTVNSKDGLGVQFIGSYGRGTNVPYGLYIYKDSDLTTNSTALQSDDFIMTVEGYIKAKGIGWFKTDTGSVNGKLTATIGLWNSDNVSLSFGGSGNDIYYSYNGTAYSLWSVVNQHFSDRRLKENIVDCKHKALDYIQQFQFKEYDWKKQEDRPQKAHTRIGLIAQEVQAVDPTLVYENGDTLNLDNLRLTNIALKAIQELSQRIETLERKLA
nr:MAG TPA: Neck appendage protein [Caudoviricetes sp.]